MGGSIGWDVFAILLGGGSGIGSVKALQSTQARFRGGQF